MLTARRLRERQAQEAAGLPPPSPRRPLEIPYHQHETEMAALEARLRTELAAPSAVIELKLDEEPLKSAVADLVAEFEERAAEVVAKAEALEAWKASLLPADHKRPTIEAFVAQGYEADLYEARMSEWERELVHADSLKRIAELTEQLELATASAAAAGKELLELKARADEPGAKAELSAQVQPTETEPAAPAAAPPVSTTEEAAKPKGGKPKPR